MKKILIISSSFYPINSPRSFRTTELAKELSRQGHDVTLMVPYQEALHKDFGVKFNLKFKNLGQSSYKEIRTSYNNRVVRLTMRIVRRLFNYLFDYPNIEWLFKTRKALLNSTIKYDLLISIATPHPIHWGVATIRSIKDKCHVWVADCGDPFMGSTTDTFGKPFYFKYLEKLWGKKSDYISIPFQGAKEAYYREFHDKIRIIPQGFNFDDININHQQVVKNEIPTFAYTGSLIPGVRDVEPLIRFLLSLNIEFKFLLYTKSIQKSATIVREAEGKVELRDYIPRKELIEKVLCKVDFLVDLKNNVSTQSPSKLIDYYLAGRPVLSIHSYEFEKDVVLDFLEGNYTKKYEMHYPEQYRIDRVAKDFIQLN